MCLCASSLIQSAFAASHVCVHVHSMVTSQISQITDAAGLTDLGLGQNNVAYDDDEAAETMQEHQLRELYELFNSKHSLLHGDNLSAHDSKATLVPILIDLLMYEHAGLVNKAFELLVEYYSKRETFFKMLQRVQLLDPSKAKLQDEIDRELVELRELKHGYIVWAGELDDQVEVAVAMMTPSRMHQRFEGEARLIDLIGNMIRRMLTSTEGVSADTSASESKSESRSTLDLIDDLSHALEKEINTVTVDSENQSLLR